MNVTAFLRKTKSKTKATVYFRVRDNDCNCDLKAASELSIHPQQWDSKRMGYKTRVTIISDAERLAFNSAVQELIREISRTYFKGATSEWLKRLSLFSSSASIQTGGNKMCGSQTVSNCRPIH